MSRLPDYDFGKLEEESKNPLKSKTLWGLAVIFITGFVRKHFPEEYRGEVVDGILIFLQWAFGPGLIFLGRWFAEVRLKWFPSKNTTTLPLLFALLLPAPLLLMQTTGCAALGDLAAQGTPQDQVAKMEAVFNTSLQALTLARAKKLIDDNTWDKSVIPLAEAIDSGLDELKKVAESGQSLSTSNALRIVNASLDRLIVLEKENSNGGIRTGSSGNEVGGGVPSDAPNSWQP